MDDVTGLLADEAGSPDVDLLADLAEAVGLESREVVAVVGGLSPLSASDCTLVVDALVVDVLVVGLGEGRSDERVLYRPEPSELCLLRRRVSLEGLLFLPSASSPS